jgi:hypothetical protein
MQVPEICKLDADTTMQEIRKKAPFYLPEWSTEDERDFGVILSNIFSGMVDSISSRLNETPKKHFLSFLEMVNVSLIPASPARAPLTFILSGGASEAVLLEASTQVSADGPDGKAVIFETEKNVLATPSKLVSVFGVIGAIKGDDEKERDKIFNHKVAINGDEPTELFAGDSHQKHILYIGDESLFNVEKGHISLEFGLDEVELKKFSTEQGLVEWQYSVESIVKENGKEVKKTDWKKILETKLVEKRLLLITENKPIDKVKLNGIESRWLKCQLIDSKIEDLKNLSINCINVLISPPNVLTDLKKSQQTFHNVDPDCLFLNDIPLDPMSDFCPFGKKPYIYDTFYIGSKDAFSKKGNKIVLTLSLTPGRPSSINKAESSINGVESSVSEVDKPQLSWEFWDGESWSLLPIQGNEWEKNLCEKIESDESNESKPTIYELMISRMPEVKLTRINGKENYWIRVRMVGGNYGKEYEIISSGEIIDAQGNKVSCAKVVPGHFFPPQITNLKINFETKNNNDTDQPKQPEYIFTENNLVFKSILEELAKNKSFKPFEPLPDIPPSIYFGFDKELKKGPFSLFINVEESIEYPETFQPKVKWQYLVDFYLDVWEELEVLDETAGFTKKGMVQFNIPGNMKASGLFGLRNQYWIRAINVQYKKTKINEKSIVLKKGQETSTPINQGRKTDFNIFNIEFSSESDQKFSPKIFGIYLNSVWAVQSKTIRDELLGSGNGEINQNFKLVNAPVISESVWINEFTTISERDRKILLSEHDRVKSIQDSKGNITEFWVRWTHVSDFLDSGNKDRHYTIDRTDGDVTFGNGNSGMVPPIGTDNIKVTYSIGGGKSGNIDASKISKLQSSIAFVDKVFNPIGSSGGTETEDIESLLKRAPTIFKKRDRATAIEDYEWLAKKASDQIARVKALPNFNSEGKFSTGWVTVVIVPESSSSKPVPSSELKRRVTSYLKERCPTVVTLRVIPPHYVKIDVSAELITASIDAIPVIEKAARNNISEFLHPLSGNTERKGWNFGCSICISDIYSVLEQIADVDYVNKVIINLYDDSNDTGSSMKLSDESSVAKLPAYALPYSGEHEITVTFKSTEKGG